VRRLVALAAALAWPTAALAQGTGLETKDYRIVTDQTSSNFNTGAFTMPHAVRFTRPGTSATADRATGNFKDGTATLMGNVVVHDNGNAPEIGKASGAYNGSGPATLTCDRLDVDSKRKLYTATGHMHFVQGTTNATADRAVLDRGSGTLHLEGGVRLSQNGATLSADTVDYNLNSRDAEVHGSPAVMTQPEQSGTSAGGGAKPSSPRAPSRRPSPRPSRKP